MNKARDLRLIWLAAAAFALMVMFAITSASAPQAGAQQSGQKSQDLGDGVTATNKIRDEKVKPEKPIFGEPISAAEAQAEIDQEKQDNPRSSRTKRILSRLAHVDLRRGAALRLAQKKFDFLFDRALRAEDLLPGTVTELRGDRSAVVDVPGQAGKTLYSSFRPLSVRREDGSRSLVDLRLIKQGSEFVPRMTDTTLRLPKSLSGGVEVPGSGAILNFRGAGKATAAKRFKDQGGLIYGGLKRDTDLLLSPTGNGMRIAYQIRSRRAPTKVKIDVGLPEGGILRDNRKTDNIVVEVDGEPESSITAPIALDADGRAISTDIEIVGAQRDRLKITTNHRKGKPAFPIIVDPEAGVYYGFDGNTTEGWDYVEYHGGYEEAPIFGGLIIAANPGYYKKGHRGIYYERVPHYSSAFGAHGQGTTAYFSGMTTDWNYDRGDHNPDPYSPFLSFGIFGVDAQGDPDSSFYLKRRTVYGTKSGETTHTSGPNQGDDYAKQLMFEMTASINRTLGDFSSQKRNGFAYDIAVGLTDPDDPVVTQTTLSPQSGWLGDGEQASAHLIGYDTGLGVKTSVLRIGSTTPKTYEEPCNGRTGETKCPQLPDTEFKIKASNYASGVYPLSGYFLDVLSSPSSEPSIGTLRVDRTDPAEPTASGPLAPGGSGNGNTVTINATDVHSGVSSIELKVDGEVVKTKDFGDCPDVNAGGCSREMDYTLDPDEYPPDNSYTFEATSTDQVGRTSPTKTWTTNFDYEHNLTFSDSLHEARTSGGLDVLIDGPTKLRVNVQPNADLQDAPAITEIEIQVRQNNNPWETAYVSQDECDGAPKFCEITYEHFPERWGRGFRDIRALATDEAGVQTTKQIEVEQAEPRTGSLRHYSFQSFPLADRTNARVNVANGNLLLDERDLNIAGTGLDLGLTRSYNSHDDVENGEFGQGWTFSTGTGLTLKEESGDVRFAGPSGYRILFTENTDDPDKDFDSPKGIDAELIKQGPDDYKLKLQQSEQAFDFIRLNNSNLFALNAHRDKNGHTISFTRTNGLLTKITDTQGNYPGGDPGGHEVTFTHQSFGGSMRITEMRDSAGTSGELDDRVWAYGYDTEGNLTNFTDPESNQTAYGYDDEGRLASITDPLGTVTEIDYASQPGNESRSVAAISRDANDNDGDGSAADAFETTYAYDTNDGTCNEAPDAGEENVQILANTASDPRGTPSDPRDTETIYCNNDETEIDRTKDPRGIVYDRSYNPRGNVDLYSRGTQGATQSDPSYDGANRLSSSSQTTGDGTLDSSVDSYEQNSDGSESFRPTETTDTQGNKTGMTYQDANLTTITMTEGPGDPNGDGETNTSTPIKLDRYGPEDDDYRTILKGLVRKSKVDAGDPDDPGDDTVRTRYAYNDEGDISSVKPPNPQTQISYETDQLNRISQVIDANGVRHTYGYDDLDRTIEVRHYGMEAGVEYRFNRMSYDANGNLTSRTDGAMLLTGSEDQVQTDTFTYDARNLTSSESYRSGANNTYTYDLAGNLSTMDDAAGTTTYDYNDVNLVNRITEPGASNSINLFYEDEGDENPQSNNLEKIVFPGTTQNFTYDDADRIKTINASSSGTTHVDLAWDYRKSGSQTGLRQSVEDKTREITTDYGYDWMDRLVSATESGSGGENEWTYLYNDATELVESTHDDGSSTDTTTYDHRNAHEISSRDGDTFTYDPQGNLTQIDGGLSLAYNDLNQTRQVNPDGATEPPVDMGYAGSGQSDRRSRDEVAGDSTDYVPNLTGLGYETMTAPAGQPETTYYTRMPSGQPLAMRTPTETYYYISDSIGSVVAMVDPQGSLSGQYRYDPYGNAILATEQAQNPNRFAGLYYDHPTGLYKAGARYYDSTTTNWTQKDPVKQVADPNEANPYVYAGADPVNSVDPSGLFIDDVVNAVGDVAEYGAGVAFSCTPVPIPTSERQLEYGAVGFGVGFGLGAESASDLGGVGRVGVGLASGGAGYRIGESVGQAVDCAGALVP